MAAEMLSADQVADLQDHWNMRKRSFPSDALAGTYIANAAQDVAALVAQDGRWRALVGALLDALRDAPITHVQTALWLWHDGEPATATAQPASTRLLAALNMAQAALADAPPAPREPSA